MAKRGENIRKRTDGRWEGRYIVSYSDSGKACYHSVYGKSYAEVKEKVRQYKTCTDQNISSKITTIHNLRASRKQGGKLHK